MRKAVRSVVVAVLAFVVVTMPSVARGDGRVALVVGNSTYAHIGRLPNPDNDARDISAALRRLGFEVTTELDADRVELTEALRAFTRRSAGADVSLVFYAGHGIEMDGVNYLVPVDARLERDVDVRFETVTVDDLLVSTTGAALRLVILDACRNNPLARSMQRTAAIRSVSGGSFAGLNEDLLGDETLVAYAAAAGTTAADGRERNSPYTAALLSHLETPLEIGLLFRRVRAAVLASTNGAQRPHEYHSLVGEHYLTPTLAAGTAGTSVTASAAPVNPAPADPPQANPPEPDITELHIVTLRERAEAGDAAAQHEMAERYANGRGVGRDFGVAMSWYVRAAEQGHVPAQLEVGRRYAAGQGVQRNDAIAASWFRRAAEQGDPRAQFDIGVMYRDGRGVAQDYAAALSWFRRLADSGDAGGQEALGDLYETGRGVEQDDATALSWYRRAAERGSASAQNRLGVMYSDGVGVARDDEAATAWFRMAAEQGYAPAQTELGESYEGGRGVGRDYTAAVSWYRRAAEQGHAPGQVALGYMYLTGRGVEEDDAEGLRWYRRAADQGYARAQNALGSFYSLGFRGVDEDEEEAVRWYRRAAEQGLAIAQISLGRKYENGRRRAAGLRGGGALVPPCGRPGIRWTGKVSSVGCTRTDAACNGTARRLPACTDWQPSRDIGSHRRNLDRLGR